MASTNERELHRLEDVTIFDLQSEAHGLIDTLVFYGWSRNGVYRQLAQRLGVPEKMAHIGNMATMTQVQRAIAALKGMRREQKQRYRGILRERAKKNPVPKKNPTKFDRRKNPAMVLPINEQKAALARLQEENRIRQEKAEAAAKRDAEILEELERYPHFLRPVVRFLKYSDEEEG